MKKKQETLRLETPEPLRNLMVWYLGAAVFWLVFGTLVGQYVGMKFIWPEMDQSSWLSFGRLRPVHTNTVFWGWASMAMVDWVTLLCPALPIPGFILIPLQRQLGT